MTMQGISGLITRQPLANYSVGFMNQQDDFIATQLFPIKAVSNRTGSFYQMTKDLFRAETALDAPSGSEAKSSHLNWVSKTFTTKEYAHKFLVLGRDERDHDDSIGSLNQAAAEVNAQKLLLDMEIAAAAKATTAANYPAALVTTLGGGATWADAVDPLVAIRAMRLAVFAQSGVWPNRLALSRQGYETLRYNASILDRIQAGNVGRTPNAQDLASLLELEGIDVSGAMKNTGNEGAAVTLSSVWADNAVLYYRTNMGSRTASYGQTFMVGTGMYTKRIDAPELGRQAGAWWIESGWEYTHEFITTVSDSDGDAIAGALIANVF